jgi:multidrug efflux pump subunit AcrB
VRWKWLTIIGDGALFALSVGGMGLRPAAVLPVLRPAELIVDWNLPQNASIAETRDQMDRSRSRLGRQSRYRPLESYVGQGAVRFVLSYDVQPANPYFGQTSS